MPNSERCHLLYGWWQIGWSVLVVLMLAGGTPRAAAQSASDVYGTRALGMGGAVRALATDGTALDLNPAALGLLGAYLVEIDSRTYPTESGEMLRLTFIDHLTSKLATAASWSWFTADALPVEGNPSWVVVGEPTGQLEAYRAQDYKLGFALPIGPFAVGTTFAWHRYRQALETRLEETDSRSRFTMNGGLMYVPKPFLRLALSGAHLIPTGLVSRPTTVGLGVAALAGNIAMAEADVAMDLTTGRDLIDAERISWDTVGFNLNLGAQITLWRFVPFRLGYYSESAIDAHYLTSGIGLEAPMFRLNYAIRYPMGVDRDLALSDRLYHMISLSVVVGGRGAGR